MTLRQANGPSGPSGPHPGRHAAEIIHSVEGAVEHAVEAAEQSLAQRLGEGGMLVLLWSLRSLGGLLLAAYFAFCLSLIGLRVWWMPHIDHFRGSIEKSASALLKQHVTIGHIESGWQGFDPRLQLTDVELHDDTGAVALTLPQIDAVFSWTSVPTWQWRLKSLTVLAPQIEVRRLSESQLKIGGVLIDLQAKGSSTALLSWVLEQHHVAISHAVVHYYDDAGRADAPPDAAPVAPVDLTDVDALLMHHFGTHYFALRARPPTDIADLIDIRGWFDRPWSVPVSDPAGWSGRLFVQLNYIDLAKAESFARLLPAPYRLWRGNGALRAWVDFDALTMQRARADIAFTDVSLLLRSDGEPLRLSSLQGRITQQAWRTASSQGQDIALKQLAFEGPGHLHLPPTDVTYRISRPLAPANAPAHTEVGINVLSLEDLVALASHMPLPAQAEDLIIRYSLRGTLADLHAAWDGEPERITDIALRTRFDRLAAAAQPAEPALDANGRPRAGQPGFENLSGSLDMSPGSGTLTLASADARLTFPGLLEDPDVPFSRLDAHVRWKTAPALQLSVDTLAISNDDLELSGAGTYRVDADAAAWADVEASLARANAAAVYRYLPLGAGVGARTWLREALREGRLSAGTVKLHGRLDAFPFLARDSGEFEASLHVSGATLDYAPSTPQHVRPRPWPLMTGVETDLTVRGDHIDILAGRASVYGVRLTNVSGRVSQLGTRDPHLTISGQGTGQLADLVGYVNASPVGPMIGGFLEPAKATGPSRLQIKLDVPLNHSADTAVDGSVFFQGNDVALRSDISPLTTVSGRLDFDQHGIRIPGLNAGFVGGQAHITADTTNGAVNVQVAGTVTPQGLRRQMDSAVVRRLLDSSRGAPRYTLMLTFSGQTVEMHAASDLTGLMIDLPEPLGKSVTDALPLRIDVVPGQFTPLVRDSLHVTAGRLVDVQLERVADPAQDGAMRVERGVVSIGSAGALPEAGLLVHVTLARLDTDRWLRVLESAPEEAAAGVAGATGATVPDLVAAHIDQLWISGKRLDNVVLGASRAVDGGWNANIAADQTSGSMHWLSGTRSVPGKLTARLARLYIPESEPVTQVLDQPVRELPELDVVAEDFVLGSSRLGHLELDAQNFRSNHGISWQVKRLQIDNPDGHIAGSGQWQHEPGLQKRRMTLTISVDVVNAGNLLGRFGLPGAIKNGSGKLSGDLAWFGSPFSIDYPTLSGDLQLAAEKGQFLKAEPGAGRLLGVMSLQSLPRRISLDFRDIFSKGFAFDSIKATAHISNGVLTTHDFKMLGPDASVLIEGATDLRAESQNLHVVVLPEINAGSASLVYAFLANPAVGVGTFLAQWLLRHPLSKIFSYEYDITGSWAEPQVKRHERAKPETPEEKTG
jgi:uncharacterized protein (TIGR02099 family)